MIAAMHHFILTPKRRFTSIENIFLRTYYIQRLVPLIRTFYYQSPRERVLW